MPDIIYTLNYVPGQFDDTPENEQNEQRINELNDNEEWDNATGGPSEGSSLSAGRGVSDEAKKKMKFQMVNYPFLSRWATKKTFGDKQKNSDKSDRATVEQVLDPRTRIILFKMINRNVIYEINGCVSTGKETNVYHAITEDGNHRAIKVYETSILVFKDRDRYVTGNLDLDMVIVNIIQEKWLKIMGGKSNEKFKEIMANWAYPRLKDAVIHSDKYPELYYQLIKNMIIMYHKCRLIHADLNEYNLLDISNVTEYFKRKGVRVIRELFDFITDINIGLDDKQVEAELDKIQERLAQQELSITLNEDIDKMSKDLVDEELIYRRLTGLSIDDKAEKIPNENEVMERKKAAKEVAEEKRKNPKLSKCVK
ncbi:hypothetical protein RhiirA4_515303 [Rhizophagus irregularis]|uniref:non-specific serine/threonine protein kinase n=1 Tax=Rhizophagus irregularis TaxID=588596 RepID=A0A2I1GED5_9GLOM|nr:hypothetical protein RhiirA4_515303 [Rhizophagus irregularis]